MILSRKALIALTLAVLACGRSQDAKPAGKPTIALVMKTMNNPFFVDMEKGARQAADSLGIELVVQAPDKETDVERQMQIVENLISRQVSAIALVPSGSREIVPAVGKANAAKIPVIVVDTKVDAAAMTAARAASATFIGSDNEDGGRLAGEYLATSLGGKGEVAVLEGVAGHETSDSRMRGFRAAIAKYPGITIVASQPANMERDLAFNVTENMLQAHPKLNGIFACNDVMALGAVEAARTASKGGALKIVGFDAQDEARKAVADGRMLATVAQNPIAMGHLAVLSAWRILHGEQVPANQPVAIELVHK